MISELLSKNNLPLIIGVEVHVKHIDIAVTMIIDYDTARRRILGFAISVWAYTFEPGWILRYIFIRASTQVHIVTDFADFVNVLGGVKGVEGIKVAQRQGIRIARDKSSWGCRMLMRKSRMCVLELSSNV